jgi:phospholipid/cholesterol/gamma-HCH transport system substrate-binding protein
MSRKPHYFMIGLFILAGMAVGVGALVLLSADALREPSQFIETYVDESIQGIEVGSPFKFRGVKVGSVSEISVVSLEYDTERMYVMIRVALIENEFAEDQAELSQLVAQEVERGLRVKIVPMGITGLSILEADYYPNEPQERLAVDWDPKCVYIPSTPALMTRLGRSVNRITDQLNQINLEQIGYNIELLTSNLNASIEHVEAITASAKEVAAPLFSNIEAAGEQLPQLTTHLNEVIVNTDRLVDGVDLRVQELMDRVHLTMDDVRELVSLLRRNPGVLLSQPPAKE